MPSSAVAVTGIGIISSIGVGRAAFWDALCAGASGIRPIEAPLRHDGVPRIAAPVGDFAARELIRSPQLRRMDRLSRMAVAASRLALGDAHLAPDGVAAERAGIVFGTALGDIEDSCGHLERIFTRGPSAASPMVFPNLVMNAPAGYVAMELGFTGVNFTVAQAEVTGEHAVALGCDVLQSGRADVVLAGAADALSPIVFHVYHRARMLAGQRGGREWSSPYDAARSGIVLGEGAAMLVLEPLAAARARGATVYATVEETCRFSVPAPPHEWPLRADPARAGLRRLVDGSVDLICGGANSSRRLDRCELALFADAVASRAGATSVTSIKGALGEFGAAGALTVAAACLGLHAQAVPPLCHLHAPEPDVPFRFAAPRAAAARIERALVCGIARGGAGVALSLQRQ